MLGKLNSTRLLVFVAVAFLVALNKKLNLGINIEEVLALAGVALAYIFGNTKRPS